MWEFSIGGLLRRAFFSSYLRYQVIVTQNYEPYQYQVLKILTSGKSYSCQHFVLSQSGWWL